MAVFQFLHEVEVAPGVLVHALDKRRLCLGDGLDLGRDDVAEIIQTDVPLTLDAEGRDAVPGDLGKQGAADPLDAKGEAGVLDGAGMTKVTEHGQEFCSFFLVQPIQKVGDMGVGVTELCGSRHHLFRFRGVGDQTNSHHRVILPP